MPSSWLDEHLETFVRPHLGYIPNTYSIFTKPKNDNYAYDQKKSYLENWLPIHCKALKAVWERAKVRSEGRLILLAGRDVFLLEVMAKLEGYPTTFRPEISRAVVEYIKDDYSKYYCVDTGYSGSIPKILKCEKWDLISYSGGLIPQEDHQLFPHAKSYNKAPYVDGVVRSLAGKLENITKYWTRGIWSNGKVIQNLESKPTFEIAAILTMHIVKTLQGDPFFVAMKQRKAQIQTLYPPPPPPPTQTLTIKTLVYPPITQFFPSNMGSHISFSSLGLGCEG